MKTWNMWRRMALIGSLLSVSSGNLFAAEQSPVETVDYVDLNRYLGRWYEIASFPQSFQRGCTATTADYKMRPDGRISVLNSCRIDSPSGRLKEAQGVAWVDDEHTNAKLKVRFFWPFTGDYWIIDLGEDYEYAVVGDPTRNYLWILSRTPKMAQTTYDDILQRLIETQDYDVSRLQQTVQP